MSEPRKKVLIKIIAEHIIDVPADWGEAEIEFWFNGSSHCISNDLLDCAEEKHRDDGTCSWLDIDYEYVREATEEDLALLEGSRQLS